MPLTLEERLGELCDKQEIEEVILRFARGSDRRDGDLLASLFHPDGIFDHPQLPGSPEPAGTPGWGKRAVATLNGLGKRSMHFVPQTLIDLDGDVAYAESYGWTCVVKRRGDEEYAMARAVRLFHKLERREDRRWKIVYRTVRVEGFQIENDLSKWTAPVHARGANDRSDLVYHMASDLCYRGEEQQ